MTAVDDAPTPEQVEPKGFLQLECADTGTIELRIDMLPVIRQYQRDMPQTWVAAVDRYDDHIDFWWPSIRRITVATHRGRARQHEIDEALEREASQRASRWDA